MKKFKRPSLLRKFEVLLMCFFIGLSIECVVAASYRSAIDCVSVPGRISEEFESEFRIRKKRQIRKKARPTLSFKALCEIVIVCDSRKERMLSRKGPEVERLRGSELTCFFSVPVSGVSYIYIGWSTLWRMISATVYTYTACLKSQKTRPECQGPNRPARPRIEFYHFGTI